MTRPSQVAAVWLIAAALLAAAAIGARGQRGSTGALAHLEGASAGSPRIAAQRVPAIDLPGAPLRARWTAWWLVPSAGLHRIVVDTDGAVTVQVDGRAVLAADASRTRAEVELQPGLHALEVAYERGGEVPWLRLQWSPPTGGRRAFSGAAIFTAPPTPRQLAWARAAGPLAVASLAVLLLPPLGAAIWLVACRVRWGRWPVDRLPPAWAHRAPTLKRALIIALPAVVMLLGGALRFEALVARYGWAGPAWALDAAREISALHPDTLAWQPTEEHRGGDPYFYYRRAREMQGFYEPHVREPVFPFAARLLLPLVGDRPLVVNVASALFSTLALLATYMLGTALCSRGVGLGAALFLALDRDAVWWGVEGFRDDAFMLFVVLSAVALVRLRREPGFAMALLAGLAGGAACLTRITALAFLLPAWAVIAAPPGADAAARRRRTGLAALVSMTLVAPFLLSCALAFGDPLYSVNAHTKFYRARGGLASERAMSWSGYLGSAFAPAELAETGLRGLTTEPFASKWRGLDYLSPWLRRLLAPLAVAGLLVLAASGQGRLVLVILLGCLLPYAFTWRVPGGAEWRFTLPAYPFYLVAALLAVPQGLATLRRVQERVAWRRAAAAREA